MKSELEKKLIEKYPIFFEYLKRNDEPIIPIQFGIECGNGWYWLLDNLMGDIQSYTKSNCERIRIKNKLIRNFNMFLSKVSNKLPHKFSKHIWKINRYINNNFKKETYNKFEPIKITQIKEKFGGLRFYYDGGDDMIGGMVWLAESMSLNICEQCGSTENVKQRGHNWIYTACNKCEENNSKN